MLFHVMHKFYSRWASGLFVVFSVLSGLVGFLLQRYGGIHFLLQVLPFLIAMPFAISAAFFNAAYKLQGPHVTPDKNPRIIHYVKAFFFTSLLLILGLIVFIATKTLNYFFPFYMLGAFLLAMLYVSLRSMIYRYYYDDDSISSMRMGHPCVFCIFLVVFLTFILYLTDSIWTADRFITVDYVYIMNSALCLLPACVIGSLFLANNIMGDANSDTYPLIIGFMLPALMLSVVAYVAVVAKSHHTSILFLSEWAFVTITALCITSACVKWITWSSSIASGKNISPNKNKHKNLNDQKYLLAMRVVLNYLFSKRMYFAHLKLRRVYHKALCAYKAGQCITKNDSAAFPRVLKEMFQKRPFEEISIRLSEQLQLNTSVILEFIRLSLIPFIIIFSVYIACLRPSFSHFSLVRMVCSMGVPLAIFTICGICRLYRIYRLQTIKNDAYAVGCPPITCADKFIKRFITKEQAGALNQCLNAHEDKWKQEAYNTNVTKNEINNASKKENKPLFGLITEFVDSKEGGLAHLYKTNNHEILSIESGSELTSNFK